MSTDTVPNNVSHLSGYERTEQGRRPGSVDHRPNRVAANDTHASKSKFVAKGHDAQLQDAQFGKIPVRVTLISGSVIRGTVSKRDKFTITINHESGDFAGCDEIVYKHAIEGVMLLRDEIKKAA